jgi:hypothetical protein
MCLNITRLAGLDWINLAQDMEKWQAVVNTKTNYRVP